MMYAKSLGLPHVYTTEFDGKLFNETLLDSSVKPHMSMSLQQCTSENVKKNRSFSGRIGNDKPKRQHRQNENNKDNKK